MSRRCGDHQGTDVHGQVEALTRLAAMPAKKRLAVLIAIAAIAAAVAGCGSDEVKGTLTAEQAAQLSTDLDAVQQATDGNDCSTAAFAVRQFRADVFGLPSETGTELKAALQDGGQQLSTLVADQCGTASGTTGATGDQTASSPSSKDTTSRTSSTTSTPTATTPDTATAPTEEPPSPPSGGNGNPSGNGNGQGNGNPGNGNPSGGGSTGGGTGGTGVGGG